MFAKTEILKNTEQVIKIELIVNRDRCYQIKG